MRVLLIDDHVLFAQSLAIALSDFSEIERFSNTKDISRLETVMAQEKPDILLMDINLGKLTQEDGLLLAEQILKRFPEQKIVILSGYDLPAYRKEARKIGVKGFVNKEVEPEELLNILISICEGKTYFQQENSMIEDLTDTEKQVLCLLADGTKRKEIAKQLFLSERTVSNRLQHIFEKLQVNSAVEAVTKAIQLGYIPPIS